MSELAREVEAVELGAAKRRFLDCYGKTGFLTVKLALQESGLSRSQYNAALRDDPEFHAAIEEVREDKGDMIEEMALKKAGVIPVDEKEKKGLWRFSDTMIGGLLRVYRNQPDGQTFNNFQIHVNGIPGVMGLSAPLTVAPQTADAYLSPGSSQPLLGDGEDCQRQA